MKWAKDGGDAPCMRTNAASMSLHSRWASTSDLLLSLITEKQYTFLTDFPSTAIVYHRVRLKNRCTELSVERFKWTPYKYPLQGSMLNTRSNAWPTWVATKLTIYAELPVIPRVLPDSPGQVPSNVERVLRIFTI